MLGWACRRHSRTPSSYIYLTASMFQKGQFCSPHMRLCIFKNLISHVSHTLPRNPWKEGVVLGGFTSPLLSVLVWQAERSCRPQQRATWINNTRTLCHTVWEITFTIWPYNNSKATFLEKVQSQSHQKRLKQPFILLKISCKYVTKWHSSMTEDQEHMPNHFMFNLAAGKWMYKANLS